MTDKTKDMEFWFAKPKSGAIKEIVDKVDRRMETERKKVGAMLP